MSTHEKLLKKVEQDRSKGQLDRALSRLKEALVENPSDFLLVQEAASLSFELGRTLDGAAILRTALRRCPNDRPFALEMLQREFLSTRQLELGEILFDAYLSQPDLDRARDTLDGLTDADRPRLLSKLRAKIVAVRQDAPDDAPRLAGLLLAESLVASSVHDSSAVAATLEEVLDLDPAQIDTVGRLCKLEQRQSPECGPIQLLLARCYAGVGKPELAAEQLVQAGRHPELRQRALTLASTWGDSAWITAARAELLLASQDFAGAEALLAPLVRSEENHAGLVRHALESVGEATQATTGLRLLYARVLSGTGAPRLAFKELQEAHAAGADAAACLDAAERVLAEDARNIDLLLLRARLSLDSGRTDVAVESYRQVLALDPGRADKLCPEFEAASRREPDAELGRFLVDVYQQLEMPREAIASLCRLRDSACAAPALLFELSSAVAAKYGLSAALTLVFVEAAVDLEREREARAAVAHYVGSPGAHVGEFTELLSKLLHERPEFAPALAPVLEGLALPHELRLAMAVTQLDQGRADAALSELEALCSATPALREPALAALEKYLDRDDALASARILAANLCDAKGWTLQAAQHLSRAVQQDAGEADRVCKIAEKALRRDPLQTDAWREVVFALVDSNRHRHARELCHVAAQVLPEEKRGFVHAALGEVLLASNQLQPAVGEFESALGREDVPLERIIGNLQVAVQNDPKHGYACCVLASALLRQGTSLDEAIARLSQAVQQDDLLVDTAFDLLAEHSARLARHAAAQLLEGTLRLRRGERDHGIRVIDDAIGLDAALAANALPLLESEWDHDPHASAVGAALARALHLVGQSRRSCRLLGELGRRFPAEGARFAAELERIAAAENLAEAHRILWDMRLQSGDRQAALEHLQRGVAVVASDHDACRDLLESAMRQLPDEIWIVCQLAQLECATGHDERGVELWRNVLELDPQNGPRVLESMRSILSAPTSPAMHLLEVDCWQNGGHIEEALESLRRFRTTYPEQRQDALERYRALIATGKAGVGADFDLGSMLQEAGRVEDAVAAFEAGVQRPAETPRGDMEHGSVERQLRLSLATLYVELGREREGKDLLSSVLDRPGSHQETYGFLERLAQKGMLGKVANLRETIAASPGNLRARLELARLSIVSLDFDGAREALSFTGDSVAVEATRRYLLARSHADQEQPQLAIAVLRSIQLDDVPDDELRRNITYLKGICCEQLGNYAEAHTLFLQLMSEAPYFKDTRDRARGTYQKHLESALESRAELLEKRTQLDLT